MNCPVNTYSVTALDSMEDLFYTELFEFGIRPQLLKLHCLHTCGGYRF